MGHRSDNPADTVKAILAKHQSLETKGHRSLPYPRVGDAVSRVRASQEWIGTLLAFEFLVLCAARAGEVRMEIDRILAELAKSGYAAGTRSSRNSEAGSVPATRSRSRARVHAT